MAREYLAAEGDGSRGTNIAGRSPGPTYLDVIDYFAIKTLGNALDFGEITQARLLTQSSSDGNRAVTAAGHTGSFVDTLDCFSFQALGDATDFGELSLARHSPGATSNGSRGIMASGEQPTQSPIDPDIIDYITIGTFCNALDWGGEMTTGRRQSCSTSNGDRGVWMGGYTASPTAHYDTIDYVNIGIPGMDAIDFGELTATTNHSGAGSDGSRGVRNGGATDTVPTYDTIDYITIATKGDATDFGELTQSRFGLAARAPSGD